MKKFVSLLLALIIVLSLGVVSFADGEITRYDWSETEPLIEQAFGESGNTWTIEEVNADFWLPSIYSSVELTPEQRADGCIGFYAAEGRNDYVLLNYTDSDGLALDSYLYYFLQNGSDVYMISVNGIPAIYLREPEKNSALLVFQTVEGKFFQLIFSPLAGEEVFQYSIISIRPHEEQVEEPAEPVVPINPVSGLISK